MAKNKISRREFLSRSAVIGAAGTIAGVTGVGGLMTSCGEGGEGKIKYTPLVSDKELYFPEVGDKAIDGKPIKAGIIGCGDRGSGAAFNFLESGDGLSIVAMADIFEDRLENLRRRLKEHKNNEVDDKNVYIGFDAYKKLCENPEIDVVLVTTPSLFHAYHTKYAIEQGKHVFCEKAAGIDPVSCRTFLAAIKLANQKNLNIITGAQRHHQRDYMESFKKVREGYIGKIRSAVLKWNQAHMTYRTRRPGWTDMEYMFRDFFSWNWLCGDHIIDQGVHNIDVFQWFAGLKPVSVVGMGSQLQRHTGDIFDNFSLDVVYEGDVRVNVQARQIDGCAGDVSETIYGTLGTWTSKNGQLKITDLDGNIVWEYDYEKQNEEHKQNNAYVLEHMDLVNHIRSNTSTTTNAETLVYASLTGAMGRESAYTGAELKFDEFMASDLSLMPEKLHLGNVPNFEETYKAPKMGISTREHKRG